METFNSFVSPQQFFLHVRKRKAVVPNLPFAHPGLPPFLACQVYQHVRNGRRVAFTPTATHTELVLISFSFFLGA